MRRLARSLLFVALLGSCGPVFADEVVPRVVLSNAGVASQELTFGMIPTGSTSAARSMTLVNATDIVLYEIELRVNGTSCSGYLTFPPICFSERASYVATSNCPDELAPGATCTLSVIFRPVARGGLIATLSLGFNNSNVPWSSPNVSGAVLVGAGYPLESSAAGVVPVVEYYARELDHYFYTATPEEMSLLDAGTIAGWTRTGLYFWAGPSQGPVPANSQPVCRFYGRPEAGLSSHFYSASISECQEVSQRFGHAWLLESGDYFRVELPSVYGGCSGGAIRDLHRLFNNRADVNHRYTTSFAVQNHMQFQRGWIPEGSGTYGIAMCVAR